jgi:hypothetical protein
VDNYYISVLGQLQSELTYNFVNSSGKDISDIIRGKIIMLKDVINLKNILEYDPKKGAN